MEGRNQKPQVVLKKCSVCEKVVKSVLYQKGRYYDHYICLENTQDQQFHVFKVETRLLKQVQAAKNMAGGSAGALVLYSLLKKTPGGDGPAPDPHDAAHLMGPVADNTGDMSPGDISDSPLLDDHSSIMDFLSHLDLGIIGDFLGLS